MIQQGNFRVDQPGYNAPEQHNYQQVNNKIAEQPKIMNNQINTDIKLSPYVPIPLLCSYCNTTVNTDVKKNCSYSNICCCILFTPLIWVCFQCCRKKPISCNNIYHHCPKCNQVLFSQKAC